MFREVYSPPGLRGVYLGKYFSTVQDSGAFPEEKPTFRGGKGIVVPGATGKRRGKRNRYYRGGNFGSNIPGRNWFPLWGFSGKLLEILRPILPRYQRWEQEKQSLSL